MPNIDRTTDLEETARLVVYLVKKMQKLPNPTGSAGLRPPQTKRQKASENVFARQLMCIPSVSEKIATLLVQRFRNLETLQEALRQTTFPRVEIGGAKCLGKARVARLRKHLVSAGAD